MPVSNKLLLAIALLLLPCAAFSQVKITPILNYGISYASAADGNYKGIVYSHGAKVDLYIPIRKNVGVTMGIGELFSGMRNQRTYYDTADKYTSVFDSKSTFRYVSIPLLATCKLISTNISEWWVDAGMSYNIFLSGDIDYLISTYNPKGKLIGKSRFVVPQKSGFGRNRVGIVQRFNPLTFMDVMYKVQVRYTYLKKYMLGVYYDHGLYCVFNDVTSGPKLRNAGVMLGIVM